jgi:diadenylate cyclase
MNGTALNTTQTSWWLRAFEGFGWRDGLDIAVVAVIAYFLIRVIRETRAFQMLRGLALMLVAAFIARRLSLSTTTWLLNSLLLLWGVALIVTLQPELRRMVASLGEHAFLRSLFPPSRVAFREVALACDVLVKEGWGGIIVIERDTNLAGFAESGTVLDAAISADLLATIFTPGSPLHDGAVIVKGNRLQAAGCMLPLSESKSAAAGTHGMRHRAALGITGETDALAIIVSEEHRQVALAMHAQLTPPLDVETLEHLLTLHTGKRQDRRAE